MEQAISGLEHIIRQRPAIIRQRPALEAKPEDRGSERDFWLRAEREIDRRNGPRSRRRIDWSNRHVRSISFAALLVAACLLQARPTRNFCHVCPLLRRVIAPASPSPLLVLHLIATRKRRSKRERIGCAGKTSGRLLRLRGFFRASYDMDAVDGSSTGT